jgi:hypothetical protein
VSDTDVLELGQEPRHGPSRRTVMVFLVTALALGVTAFVVDRQMREREERSVAGCAEEAATAVDMTSRPVRAAYEYVRPSLGTALGPDREAGIFRVIAKAADHPDTRLKAARRICADVAVFPLHPGLQEQRDRCVAVLDDHRAALAAVAEDGKALREWITLPRTC